MIDSEIRVGRGARVMFQTKLFHGEDRCVCVCMDALGSVIRTRTL